jgi:hypothetical protein
VQLGSTDKRVPDACGDFRLPAPRAKLRTQFELEQTDGVVRTGPCECGASIQCRRAWPRRGESPATTTNEPDRRWFPTICGMAGSTFSAFTRGFSCGYARAFKPSCLFCQMFIERSKVPLSKRVLAAQLMASSKKSTSADRLHRMLGTNYATAWFLFHRLREAAAALTRPVPSGRNPTLGSVRHVSACGQRPQTFLIAQRDGICLTRQPHAQ